MALNNRVELPLALRILGSVWTIYAGIGGTSLPPIPGLAECSVPALTPGM